MTPEEQEKAIYDLQDFLNSELTEAVKRVEGVPRDVRDVMGQALKGALDYVIHDIHPEGDGAPNFFDLLPVFGEVVG
jgi:hypothetical protein